ncbi:MAG: hypothetical protein HWQ41_11805 [Nostoc sp. NOS(2021)]|uniref:hypothetical protein n=1 Tax=Nostoc sp. NOS(2021) TaxID=2815407 RepID=UPI0025DBB3EB|nr:hypothetical protein [Nostoc sp. NOS(2021)]MBN3895914.1 hypothetical protein [Nostoc sp. NOS(2021)]
MNAPQQVTINNFSVPQLNRRLETASTRGFTHLRGLRTLDFVSVRAGGREFV